MFFSTEQAAKKIGIGLITLKRYIATKKIPLPSQRAHIRARLWSEEDIEKVKELLPKIANGRKTRYQKLKEKQKSAPPRTAAPHKKRKPKKK